MNIEKLKKQIEDSKKELSEIQVEKKYILKFLKSKGIKQKNIKSYIMKLRNEIDDLSKQNKKLYNQIEDMMKDG